MISKLIMIIKAKLRDKNKLKGVEWYEDRLRICGECPNNSKNINRKNFRYRFWKFLNLKEDFCNLCGCGLKSKASEEILECEIGKWKQIEE